MDNLIETLVNTRINGNSIKGCKTYENMLKRISKKDLENYALNFGFSSLYGNKLEMIEQLRNKIEGR